MNFTTTHIRSEKVTIDTRIYTILNGRKKPGEVYLAAIAPDMELTIITLDEAPGILPCFEEDDACLNLPNTSLLLLLKAFYYYMHVGATVVIRRDKNAGPLL